MSQHIHIGCQGWNYDDWVTPPAADAVFYPAGTRSADMLERYAQIFDSVEVDSTFYAVPSASTVTGWAKRTPDNFVFSLKLPQDITHVRGLRKCAVPVAEFVERIHLLEDKLGPILVQLPPQFEFSDENWETLNRFLDDLPPGVRFAIEFRQRAWLECAELLPTLRRQRVALALVDGSWLPVGRVQEIASELTKDDAPFAYVRWMGARDLTRFDTVQRSRPAATAAWADIIRQLAANVPVFAYFSNYYEGHAPHSAFELSKLLGQKVTSPSDLETQFSLF